LLSLILLIIALLINFYYNYVISLDSYSSIRPFRWFNLKSLKAYWKQGSFNRSSSLALKHEVPPWSKYYPSKEAGSLIFNVFRNHCWSIWDKLLFDKLKYLKTAFSYIAGFNFCTKGDPKSIPEISKPSRFGNFSIISAISVVTCSIVSLYYGTSLKIGLPLKSIFLKLPVWFLSA
jgi:hypothetical protein